MHPDTFTGLGGAESHLLEHICKFLVQSLVRYLESIESLAYEHHMAFQGIKLHTCLETNRLAGGVFEVGITHVVIVYFKVGDSEKRWQSRGSLWILHQRIHFWWVVALGGWQQQCMLCLVRCLSLQITNEVESSGILWEFWVFSPRSLNVLYSMSYQAAEHLAILYFHLPSPIWFLQLKSLDIGNQTDRSSSSIGLENTMVDEMFKLLRSTAQMSETLPSTCVK